MEAVKIKALYPLDFAWVDIEEIMEISSYISEILRNDVSREHYCDYEVLF